VRYNAEGRNPWAIYAVVTADGERVEARGSRQASCSLEGAADDGGLWTSAKVAAFIARELGLERVAVQRGWRR